MKFFQAATILFFLAVCFFLVFITTSDAFNVVGTVFSNDTGDSPMSTSTEVSTSLAASISPDGKYIIYQKNGVDEKYRSLEIKNIETGERKVLSTVTMANEFHSFLWTPDSERVYYAWTGSENAGNTTFFFYSPDDATPEGRNTISYEDDKLVLSGKVTISRVSGDLLYVQKDSKIYSIDMTKGAAAEPTEVLDIL